MFENGTKKVQVVGGPVSFYDNYTTTTLFVLRPFGGDVNTITVSNDSATDTVDLSFDAATIEGELLHGESMTLNTSSKTGIYIRGDAGGDGVRTWGW